MIPTGPLLAPAESSEQSTSEGDDLLLDNWPRSSSIRYLLFALMCDLDLTSYSTASKRMNTVLDATIEAQDSAPKVKALGLFVLRINFSASCKFLSRRFA